MGWLQKVFGSGAREEPAPSTANVAPLIGWRSNSFPMEVVGESHYQRALARVCGGHNRYGHVYDCVAVLMLDPENPHDPNAVKVTVEKNLVGFLSRDQAERVHAAMRSLSLSSASCAARIVGGWRTNQHDEGHFGIRLAIPRVGSIDFGSAGIADTDRVWPKKERVRRPTAADGGPLAGERVAILGPPAGELALKLAAAGARMMASVGKTTTMLVFEDKRPFTFGVRRSLGYVKAEELIAAGYDLKILDEEEARSILSSSPPNPLPPGTSEPAPDGAAA